MKIISDNEMTEGLFGQIILWIFEILPILEFYKVDVSSLNWQISTLNYGNIFPNILKYNFENNEYDTNTNIVKDKMNIVKLKYVRSLKPQYVLGDDFSKLNQLFFKYFTIPNELNEIADKLELQNFLKVEKNLPNKV